MKSSVYFKGKAGFSFLKKGSARLCIGGLERLQPLKNLEIESRPLLTAFIPDAEGILDDHFESWFLSFSEPPKTVPEGLESVVTLGQSQEWLTPPDAKPGLGDCL